MNEIVCNECKWPWPIHAPWCREGWRKTVIIAALLVASCEHPAETVCGDGWRAQTGNEQPACVEPSQ